MIGSSHRPCPRIFFSGMEISRKPSIISEDESFPPSVNSRCFDADTLIEWIVFLVDKLYLVVGNRIALQVIGIPLGTNCAPFLAK